MEEQQIEAAIESDLLTIRTLRLRKLSAQEYYFSIVGWVIKLSLLFLMMNTVLQRFMHLVGYYIPELSSKLFVVTWICALLASIFMSFTADRIILISKMVKGQLKTADLIRSKYLHFTLVFFAIYSVVYLVITFPIIGWMNLSDFHKADDEGLWFIFLHVGFSQFFAFIAASVGTGISSSIEFDRLGFAPLFNVIGRLSRKKRYFSMEEQK